jgi:serine-type D-Ala-D-Ala carboxypeptidase (penicillin-binding protein 5/6)
MGVSQTVPVAATKDALVTLPRGDRKDVKVTAIYDGTINAPVAKGQTVGKLVVTAPDMDPLDIPLQTTEAVARLGPLGRMAETAGYLLWGTRH